MAESALPTCTPLALELIKRIHDMAEEVEPIGHLNSAGSSECGLRLGSADLLRARVELRLRRRLVEQTRADFLTRR
jgi:hypothetical protein